MFYLVLSPVTRTAYIADRKGSIPGAEVISEYGTEQEARVARLRWWIEFHKSGDASKEAPWSLSGDLLRIFAHDANVPWEDVEKELAHV